MATNLVYGGDTQVCGLGGSPYGVSSGTAFWIGKVLSHDITEKEGVEAFRYIGGGQGRKVAEFIKGAREFDAVLKWRVQDGLFLSAAMAGSISNTGSPQFVYTISAMETISGNAPYFTIEDAQKTIANKNFVRTLNGCVAKEFTLSGKEGQFIEASVSYAAKNCIQSSGTPQTVTVLTDEMFHWDNSYTLISGAFPAMNGRLQQIKDFEFKINQNMRKTWYLNGSGTEASGANARTMSYPVLENLDYMHTITMDKAASTGNDLHEAYRCGSPFNLTWYGSRNTGSDYIQLAMSGCTIIDCDDPTKGEGILEQKVTFQPTSVTPTVRDDSVYPTFMYQP